LFWSQEEETISTFETANVLSPWSIFMPELLSLLELLLLPLALWSEAGKLPVEALVLPVLSAEGEVVLAVGDAPLVLVPVLALPLAPGALSLIAPPLPLVEAVVELLVLVPAGAVVVVVVVVVGAVPLLAEVEPLADPLMPELLLLAALPSCQSPCSFTE
jgi:hypothetical protein